MPERGLAVELVATEVVIVFFFFYFFMRTNLCNALVIQENSYSIANINLETIDTVQKIIQGQTTATTTTNT